MDKEKTDRQTDVQTYRQIDIQIYYSDRLIDRQMYKQTDKLTVRHKQTERQTDLQTYRKTDRQMYKHRDKRTDRQILEVTQ